MIPIEHISMSFVLPMDGKSREKAAQKYDEKRGNIKWERTSGTETGNLAQNMYWADLTLSGLKQPPCLGRSKPTPV